MIIRIHTGNTTITLSPKCLVRMHMKSITDMRWIPSSIFKSMI